MKSLISGSSGFIGSHLSKRLVALGHSVVPITQEQLYQPAVLTELFKKEQPDFIFHLASYGNMANQKDPAMTVFSNLIGTYNMLDASKEIDYKKFIYFSTSSVTLSSETFYSASKAGAERLANVFLQQGKPIIIARPYSIYGSGEAEFRLIPTVIRSLLQGEEMNLDPTASHDWVYIKDLIDSLILLMKSGLTGIMHMGTGRQYTNGEIVERLEKFAKKKLKFKTTKMRDFDTLSWVSPQPTVKSPLNDGLRETFKYYLKLYGN
jgi:nucleoside-diphosphate-sugar epimerase